MGGKNKRYYDYVRKWLQDGKELGKEVYDEHDSLEDYLKAPIAELEKDIRPTGFFKNKTKNIKGQDWQTKPDVRQNTF